MGKAADFLAERGYTVLGAVGSQHYEEGGGVIVKIVAPPPRQTAAVAPEAAKP